MMVRVVLAVATATLAGCASAPPPAADGGDPKPEVSAPAPAAAPAARPSRPPPRKTDPRLALLPDRPLNVTADCRFADANGYRGRLQLNVREATVHRFAAEVEVPRRGNCQFELKDFHQSDLRPTVTLRSARGDCAVRIWEQGEQVTVAFGACRQQCSGGSRDYLWPILVDARTGTCS